MTSFEAKIMNRVDALLASELPNDNAANRYAGVMEQFQGTSGRPGWATVSTEELTEQQGARVGTPPWT